MIEKCNACNGIVGADVVRTDFLVFCNEVCANSWLEARLEEEETEDQWYVLEEEAKFLAALRQPGEKTPLQDNMLQKQLDQAWENYGETIQSIADKAINSVQDIQSLLTQGFANWKVLGDVYIKEFGDLRLFNYTPKAQFEGRWNFFEQVSRGLILNEKTGEIVARPFDKFFNWGEGGRYTSTPILNVTQKMDGSLGILYRDNGHYRIATRGSFGSEQAQWATDFLRNYDLSFLPNHLTLLFEIIYPGNRIIIDYQGKEDLILLAARNRFNGEYSSWRSVKSISFLHGFSLPKVHHFKNVKEILDICKDLSSENEGWVVKFEDGQRFKFKGDRYRNLHKLISGLSFKNTLACIVEGRLTELYDIVSDEFLEDVKGWEREIQASVATTTDNIERVFNIAPKATRKEFALWVMENHKQMAPYLFAMLDSKPVKPLIYKLAF